MVPALTIDDVTRSYRIGTENYVHALRGVRLTVNPGEMVAIMGPSGSGKSTLMHIAGGLDAPSSGQTWIEQIRTDNLPDRALTRLRSKRVGFVFQGFNLLHTLTAQENVAVAAEYAGLPRRQAAQRARDLLGMLGLADRVDHRPSELSGGEQQRVAIARALINDPCILMADEPTGNLDSATSAEIMNLLSRVNAERGMTVVLVTHDPNVAARCGRVVQMQDGQGIDDGAEPAP